MELVLLETSGPFQSIDIDRETHDHVKAAYGLVAMLHRVAHKFVYADINIFRKFKVCFIHAAYDRIRLWIFSFVAERLYVLNRVASCVLPTDHRNCKDQVKQVTNTFWELKRIIKESSELLGEL